jgi:hypothetical protein
VVRYEVRGVLHQMAQVLIVDDLGGVIGLFGAEVGTYDPGEVFGR